MMSNMYAETKTWNPFVGCNFDCIYCEKSFKRQLKRVAWNIGCPDCYKYTPHVHPERRFKIPSAKNIFVCGTGDIYFCNPNYVRGNIFWGIENHKPRRPKTYFFQSKAPACFNQYLDWFQTNRDKVILLTTLETNRDIGYEKISKAPVPSKRFRDFIDLDYCRKVITIEPVLDFDLGEFLGMIRAVDDQLSLEYVWFGFDSKNCGLLEPSISKAQDFVDGLQDYGIEVRGKTLRGVHLSEEQKDVL